MNGEKYPVSIPDDVAGKMFSPSIPPDNGVNEMRYQIARIYTGKIKMMNNYSHLRKIVLKIFKEFSSLNHI